MRIIQLLVIDNLVIEKINMTPIIQEQAKTLTFTEADHKYTDENNLVYTSVTTLLEKIISHLKSSL